MGWRCDRRATYDRDCRRSPGNLKGIIKAGELARRMGRGKISGLTDDVAQCIKTFKKAVQDNEKATEKPEPEKTIDGSSAPSTAAPSDVGIEVV